MSKPNELPPTTAIEVNAHTILRDLLRQQATLDRDHADTIADWNHYLTMTRLVARGLRMSKSALIQTGVATHRREGKYRLSYLIPALLWNDAVAIVIPQAFQADLINIELSQLQQRLGITGREIDTGPTLPDPDFKGLWIVDPRTWLSHQFNSASVRQMPTIIDGADDLETLARSLLTVTLTPEDWYDLRLSHPPTKWEKIGHAKIQLLETLWQRSDNPYNCYLLDPIERSILETIIELFTPNLPPNWLKFQHQLATTVDPIIWATIDRTHGNFTLKIAPSNLIDRFAPIWEHQPTVLITSAVDINAEAIGYRQELGLAELTSVKFSLDRHADLFQLYIPRWMPMPNTPKFQPVLVAEIQQLLHLIQRQPKFVIILVSDTPLQAQLAAILAAEWGTRVQVEQTDLTEANILISGWEFWQQHQDDLPTPQLMIIATLPIPSLEDPLVAAKVSSYKQQKQDWFRLYLLPTGLRILHRAIDPIRSSQGVVAIFDNRINQRSYGKQILAALSPAARINYPNLTWLDL
jgi:ATP-dependent DNA helicase DinG